MFCGKCGAKVDDKSKFCGKCGTKVNTPDNAVNVNSLDSFIGNIVKKTNEQSMDSDVFIQIEKEAKKEVNKATKKSSTKYKKSPKPKKKSKPKAKPKPKQKPKSEPRPKSTKKVQKNTSKKINIKILIPAILLPLLIVSGIFIFNFFKNNSLIPELTPNEYVAIAASKTAKQMEKYTEKTSLMPDLSLNKNSENSFPEREIYLKVKNSKGGLINEDILGSLKGLSIKTNEKYNTEEELFNAKLTFANNKKEEIYGEVFSSPDLATVKIPDLYSDTLGVHFNDNKDTTINSQYNAKISQLLELLTEYESSYNQYKNSIKDKSGIFISDIIKNAEFTMESENEESGEREYSTILDNKYLLESLKTFLTQVKEEEFNKKVQLYLSYFIKGDSLELAQYMLIGNTDKFIASIDNAIQSDIVEDIEIKLIINKEQIISSVSFNTDIDGIKLSAKIDIEDKENSFDQKINIKLLNADKYLNLDIISSTKELSEDEINRRNTLSFTTFLDDKVTVDFNEVYNTKTNNYNNKIDFDIDSLFEDFSADYNLKGKYKAENGLERLDIDSLTLDIKTALYKFNFEFDGHIQLHNSSSIEEINLNNVIFIDNMSNQEIEDIKTKIYKNWTEFLDLFRERKW